MHIKTLIFELSYGLSSEVTNKFELYSKLACSWVLLFIFLKSNSKSVAVSFENRSLDNLDDIFGSVLEKSKNPSLHFCLSRSH